MSRNWATDLRDEDILVVAGLEWPRKRDGWEAGIGASMWAAGIEDGDETAQVKAACRANPIRHGRIRVASVAQVRATGVDLQWTPQNTPKGTLEPERHFDAFFPNLDGATMDRLIACFSEHRDNPIKEQL